jgi:hypothetical protein
MQHTAAISRQETSCFYQHYLSWKVDGIIPLDPYFPKAAEAPTLSISCTDGLYFHSSHFVDFSLYHHEQSSQTVKFLKKPSLPSMDSGMNYALTPFNGDLNHFHDLCRCE